MISVKKTLLVAVATCALSTSALSVAGAATTLGTEKLGAKPNVIGGYQAEYEPIVQLRFNVAGSGGSSGCTGEQINSEWVLTAKHCIDGAYNMRVYHSNDQLNPGPATTASKLVAAPRGDIALIKLDEPVHLPSYPRVDLNYSPRAGERGTIAGYGLGAWDRPTSTLRAATVTAVGRSSDAYGGSAVALRGVDGAANRGDSGGPLFMNGRIIAVCSTGDRYPGDNINAGSNYALLNQSANWIRSTAGL